MKIVNNFYSNDILKSLHSHYEKNLSNGKWEHGYTFYQQTGVNKPAEVFVLRVPEFKKIVGDFLVHNNYTNKFPEDIFCLIHHAGSGCSVNWHTDSPTTDDDISGDETTCGITTFLNKEWSADWGGQFLVKNTFDDTEGTFIQPSYNRAIINDGLEPHGVAPVSYNAPARLTFQIFFNRRFLVD